MAASSMKNGSQEHKRLHIYSNIFFFLITMMSFSVRGGTKLLSINQISNGSGTKYNEKRYKKHATIIIFSLSQNPSLLISMNIQTHLIQANHSINFLCEREAILDQHLL